MMHKTKTSFEFQAVFLVNKPKISNNLSYTLKRDNLYQTFVTLYIFPLKSPLPKNKYTQKTCNKKPLPKKWFKWRDRRGSNSRPSA